MDFKSEVSELAWKNFKATGNISYYSLFKAIETPEMVENDIEELER